MAVRKQTNECESGEEQKVAAVRSNMRPHISEPWTAHHTQRTGCCSKNRSVLLVDTFRREFEENTGQTAHLM